MPIMNNIIFTNFTLVKSLKLLQTPLIFHGLRLLLHFHNAVYQASLMLYTGWEPTEFGSSPQEW
jgi:hypothetical protein